MFGVRARSKKVEESISRSEWMNTRAEKKTWQARHFSSRPHHMLPPQPIRRSVIGSRCLSAPAKYDEAYY